MAKLFNFEKELRDLIHITRINSIPSGFVYDNPVSCLENEGKLSDNTSYSYEFKHFTYNDKSFFDLTIHIGNRSYLGLFYSEDFMFVSSLIDKFLALNK